MRDERYISFNLGPRSVRKVKRLLKSLRLLDLAKLDETGPLTGLCSIRLEANDSRLPRLLSELKSRGLTVIPRADRIYSPAELDAAPWLRLRLTTVGLLGGANLEQPYDYSRACTTCGAGSSPVPPLRADMNRMGKKLLDFTAHDGHLIATRDLAESLAGSGITGFGQRPVVHATGKPADGFCWLQITSEWPPLSSSSVVAKEDECPNCARAGHFDSWAEPTELHFPEVPSGVADFAATFEYFGVWRHPQMTRRPVGGARCNIVSQRCRQELLRTKVRHLSFAPVTISA